MSANCAVGELCCRGVVLSARCVITELFFGVIIINYDTIIIEGAGKVEARVATAAERYEARVKKLLEQEEKDKRLYGYYDRR